MNISKGIIAAVLAVLSWQQASAFCGFYVAKADANLFNNKSQVIMVRDGYRSVITMANDYKGAARDFAMVVPVPVVLQRNDIKVVSNQLFTQLDQYSAPRLVEYYDNNPCMQYVEEERELSFDKAPVRMLAPTAVNEIAKTDLGVTVEARYDVEEYDVLILSAKESSGLKTWLTQKGYKIPAGAEEVLEPYIKNGLKFFVVKVDLEKVQQGPNQFLRPLQIAFKSEKFMLPIRLGMANSTGEQDMIVYAFTRQGRIECTNYRTVNLPTDRNIPSTLKPKFNPFYKDLFELAYEREGKNAVFLEYAWDVTPVNPVKCDPCVGNPPQMANLVEAGVDWINQGNQRNPVHFTRLHVRYSRDKFPQDLMFQVTPNKERFQGRYVMTHAAPGDFTCEEGQAYLEQLQWRRKKEVDELASLTGWSTNDYQSYLDEYDRYIKPKALKPQKNKGSMAPVALPEDGDGPSGGLLLLLFGVLCGLSIWMGAKSNRTKMI